LVIEISLFYDTRSKNIKFVMFVCPSVRPQGTTRLPLHGFLLNLMFEYFFQIRRENSIFLKSD